MACRHVDLVTSAKILGLQWFENGIVVYILFDFIIKKAKKHLYGLSQLKRSGLGPRELVQIFRTCIRPIMEYVCPVFLWRSPCRAWMCTKAGYAHYFSSLLMQWGQG